MLLTLVHNNVSTLNVCHKISSSLSLSLFVVTLSFKTFVRQLEKFCRPINYETFDSLSDITANGGNKFYKKFC